MSNVKNNRSGNHWSGLAPGLQRLHLGDSAGVFEEFLHMGCGELCHCLSVVEARRSCGKSKITGVQQEALSVLPLQWLCWLSVLQEAPGSPQGPTAPGA